MHRSIVGAGRLGVCAARAYAWKLVDSDKPHGPHNLLGVRVEVGEPMGTGVQLHGPALMVNPIQHYVWGSYTAIADLQGREPSGLPEAELWMGAHHACPSDVIVDGVRCSLMECIDEDPNSVLGEATVARFGPRLPYLLKVLAADQPLSLQAHPTEAQATQGFHAEEAQGVPLDAPERNYRDDSAKPELLCALSRVDALCGFRDPVATMELLERLGVGRLQPLADTLRRQPPEAAMPAAVEQVLTWPHYDRASLVADLGRASRQVAADDGLFAVEASWVVRLAELHPDDPGVVAALLLNFVQLEPGEAIYLPSGNMHAYLCGVGIEVMANSDNVLRGGLTSKHVDVSELQRVLDHTAGPVELVAPERLGHDEVVYPTAAPNFQLSRLLVRSDPKVPLHGCGPQLLLCTEGVVTVRHGETSVTMKAGTSVFIPAVARPVEAYGTGAIFRAAVPTAAFSPEFRG